MLLEIKQGLLSMQIGDLVKRKPEWGDWVKYNPWMYTDKDLQIGIIVGLNGHPERGVHLKVLWPDQKLNWEGKENLEKVDGNKDRRCSSPEIRKDQ